MYSECSIRSESIYIYLNAISPKPDGASFPDASPDASPRGCIGGNLIACGRFLIPSLMGLSPSVISLAVAFCVSVIGL